MPDATIEELLETNQALLDAIARADWKTYADLCDPALTAFEPEAQGHLVHGLDFHHFYFDLAPTEKPRNLTMIAPHVRVMGDVALVAYVRLLQGLNAEGQPITAQFEETRIWQRQQGRWRHVHFHRSANHRDAGD